MNKIQTGCQRCGTCCKNGGPALHHADLPFLKDGAIPRNALITLRKGELAHNPVSGKVQPTTTELVKIAGKGRAWECYYFSAQDGCSIYDNRPQACRTLECWNPEKSLALVEKDVLSRLDILAADEPMVQLIKKQEELCPCEDLADLLGRANKRLTNEEKLRLEQIVQDDLTIRAGAVKEFGLALPEELFYFGRPYFQLLRQLGIQFFEKQGRLQIIA